MNPKDYLSELKPDWCPGCGDFGILNAITRALATLGIPGDRVAAVSGIGCSAKTIHYLAAYGIHSLHGRPLPLAQGLKVARPELTVLALAGDGDALGIGAGHFVAAGRRNVDLTYLIFNNAVYGMTKGQAAPTLPRGAKTKALARPNPQGALDPLMLAYSAGYPFIARGFAFNLKQLAELIRRGIEHPGLALIEVRQPCPTYNDLFTADYYKKHGYDLEAEGYDPRAASPAAFFERVMEPDRVAFGVFWDRPRPALAPATRERAPLKALIEAHAV